MSSTGNIYPLQYHFGAASMNDTEYCHLWVDGAAQFIPSLNKLLDMTTESMPIYDVSKFENDQQYVLGDMFMNHGSDKSTTHSYNTLYSYILNKLGRENPLNILEIGLGTNNPSIVSSMGAEGRPGASLYAFREYLPNAMIYGADVDKDILFSDQRIKTGFVDQMKPETFQSLLESFGNIPKFDFIVDDGLHSTAANLNTMIFAIDNLKIGGWFVVEDIGDRMCDNWRSIDSIMKKIPGLETFMVKTTGGYHYQNTSFVYVVHRKDYGLVTD